MTDRPSTASVAAVYDRRLQMWGALVVSAPAVLWHPLAIIPFILSILSKTLCLGVSVAKPRTKSKFLIHHDFSFQRHSKQFKGF
jgi:hypothetical protein